MIKEIIKEMPILSAIILLGFLGIAFVFVDGLAGKREYFTATVIDKKYKAKRNGTGVMVDAKGNASIATTPEREEFLLIVKRQSGKIVTAESNPQLYYQKENGQEVICIKKIGYFTGLTWSLYAIE